MYFKIRTQTPRRRGRSTHAVEVPAGQVYANITAVLASPGALPSSIIKVTTFLTEGDDGTDCVHQARAKYLGEHRPASTAVFVSRLVDQSWKTEIDAVAPVP